MKLFFLHGDPAVGKYTVGRELAALTGGELYHNHLVVDEVLRLHAFGTAEFIRLRDAKWRAYLSALPAMGERDVIFTFNPEATVPQEFVDWLFQELPRRGVAIFSVGLTASERAIEGRLASPQRKGFNKLTDRDLYRQLRAAGTFRTPAIPRTDLWVDTELNSPPEAARLIAGQVSQ